MKSQISKYVRSNGFVPTVFGHLNIEGDLLGQGGNGLVYPIDFDGPAAIKLLTEQVSDGPSRRMERFQREYKRIVRVPAHQNLVRLFHYENVNLDGTLVPAIIMERCQQSLQDYVNSVQPLSVSKLRLLCRDMCRALEHIDRHRIVHRDIKPANILLRSDDTFVLTDLGIASFDPIAFGGKKLTKPGDQLANKMFSAPEQFDKGVDVTSTADIYALGQVIYWCVTRRVFSGTSVPRMASP